MLLSLALILASLAGLSLAQLPTSEGPVCVQLCANAKNAEVSILAPGVAPNDLAGICNAPRFVAAFGRCLQDHCNAADLANGAALGQQLCASAVAASSSSAAASVTSSAGEAASSILSEASSVASSLSSASSVSSEVESSVSSALEGASSTAISASSAISSRQASASSAIASASASIAAGVSSFASSLSSVASSASAAATSTHASSAHKFNPTTTGILSVLMALVLAL